MRIMTECYFSTAPVGTEMRRVFVKRPTGLHAEFLYENEVRALEGISHENVVKLYGHDPQTHTLYLEPLDGHSLDFTYGEMSEQKKISALCQLAKGMLAVHSRSDAIVHGDIKPENTFVVGGRIVLLDFGSALPESYFVEADSNSFLAPTFKYASPEIFLDINNINRKSDVFSYGVSAAEVMYGENPFSDVAGNFSIFRLLHRDPCKGTSTSPQLDELVLACLEKRNENRPTSEEIVDRMDEFI